MSDILKASNDEKIKEITNILSKDNIFYKTINDENINTIYDLMMNNKIPDINDDTDIIVILYLAYYYRINNQKSNYIKYLMLGIEKGCSNALHALGYVCEEDKDYDNMMKYYLMAIDKDNPNAMHHMAHYYGKQKDYDNMLKYFLMAVKKGYTRAMGGPCSLLWRTKRL
jgi:tetratricopeptide (TPR) repeat protein